jgi:hypothetical protein
MQCYTCFGSGSVTCPTCNGQGSYWRPVGTRNEWFPCSQCGGKRTATCPTCGGRGAVPDQGPRITSTPQPTLAPDPALLQLEGRWKALGARYEFVKQNNGYHVTQFNILGMKIAEGEAEASGSVLTVTVRNRFTGSVTTDLQLSGNQLTGRMRGPIPLPVTLKRAA